MTPTVRKYRDKALLEQDVRRLSEQGVNKEDIYVLAHEKGETKEVAETTDTNTIGIKELGLGSAVGNLINEKGDKLRTKLREIGLSNVEADNYEEDLDQGFVLMITTGTKDADELLSNQR